MAKEEMLEFDGVVTEVLPDGNFLVTESAGRLRTITPTGAVSEPIAGVPPVKVVAAQGKLDRGLKEAQLVAGVVATSGEHDTVHAAAGLDVEGVALRELRGDLPAPARAAATE